MVLTLLLDLAPGVGRTAVVGHAERSGELLVVDLFVKLPLETGITEHLCWC